MNHLAGGKLTLPFSRVYMDKLADNKDIDNFEKIQRDILKKTFDDVPEPEVLSKPLIYCHFAK